MKYLSIVSAFFISIVFTNCNKPIGCGETRGLETSSLSISIFNTATNNYMYPREEFQSSFKKDSLQVYTGSIIASVNHVFYATFTLNH